MLKQINPKKMNPWLIVHSFLESILGVFSPIREYPRSLLISRYCHTPILFKPSRLLN